MGNIRVFGFYFSPLFLILAALEICVISLATAAAAGVRFGGHWPVAQALLGPLDYRALFVGCVLVIAMAAMGLYRTHLREGAIGALLRLTVAVLLGGCILALAYYVIPSLYLGRGVTALAMCFSLIAVYILRLFYFRLVDMDSLKPRVLVYGAGERARWVLERVSERSNRTGFRLVGFIDNGAPRKIYGDVLVLTLDEPLCDYIRRQRVDQIVVAVDDRRNSLPMADLLKCRLAGVEVLELPTFFERETGSVDLDLTDPSWLVFGDGFRRGFLVRWWKRTLDIIVSLLLMIPFGPVIALTVLVIKLEDGLKAPAFYSQIRVGEQGRHFKLYKLRSMRVDAEAATGACWARTADERVTRVGRVIRLLRFDELPQVYNVLRGDMSFVGPRPERPEFTQRLELQIRYYRERCAVKPGVTGWAQLRYPYGASERDAREKLKYDLFYIKNHNMLFDILILLQTAEVVLFGKGAR